MSTTIYGPLPELETGAIVGSKAGKAANAILEKRIQARIQEGRREIANSQARAAGKQTPGNPGPRGGGPAPLSPTQIGEGLTKQIERAGTGEGIIGKALGGIGEAGKAVSYAPGEAAQAGAEAIARPVADLLTGWVKEAVGADIVKALLYVLLAGGGAALVVTGVSRAAGLHPARAAKKAGAIAAAGAAA